MKKIVGCKNIGNVRKNWYILEKENEILMYAGGGISTERKKA